MAAILSAEHLSKSYTLKKLLTDVTIYIGEHDRIGVVGVNGTGKSTLLKLLAGMEEPDGGVVMRKNGLRVLSVEHHFEENKGRTEKLREDKNTNNSSIFRLFSVKNQGVSRVRMNHANLLKNEHFGEI